MSENPNDFINDVPLYLSKDRFNEAAERLPVTVNYSCLDWKNGRACLATGRIPYRTLQALYKQGVISLAQAQAAWACYGLQRKEKEARALFEQYILENYN